jgi:hypothetical protein
MKVLRICLFVLLKGFHCGKSDYWQYTIVEVKFCACRGDSSWYVFHGRLNNFVMEYSPRLLCRICRACISAIWILVCDRFQVVFKDFRTRGLGQMDLTCHFRRHIIQTSLRLEFPNIPRYCLNHQEQLSQHSSQSCTEGKSFLGNPYHT